MIKLFLKLRKSVFPLHSIAYVNTALKEQKSSPETSLIGSLQTISGSLSVPTLQKNLPYQNKKASLMACAQQMSKRWKASNSP
jgi:hypothetical protein